ncbi:MAG TPA: agmatinase family protein [Acidimicrobiia bacterium]|nr:agmatinase family protein [Acidimicrobiia bacterium]
MPDPHWPTAGVWLAGEASDPNLVVVGVPSSRASLFPARSDLAPLEVRERLYCFSTFHGEMEVDLDQIAVRDMGNWPVSEIDMDDLVEDIVDLAGTLPDAELTVFLGGDNAITRPLVASLSDDLSTVGLITFDAHHDVRSLESGPNNGTPVRGLIEEHGLPGANVVQIGIHSFANSAHYRAYCEEAEITTLTVSQVDQIGMPAAVDIALSRLSASCEVIYVDVDIDVLDRAFAPACPGARPGGLTVRQLAEGVARCAAHPAVRAMDLVEVDPTADIAHQTVDVMAHLLLTAAAGLAGRGKPQVV